MCKPLNLNLPTRLPKTLLPTCQPAYLAMWLPDCWKAQLLTGNPAKLPICLPAKLPTFNSTYLPTSVPANLRACRMSNLLNCVPACLPACLSACLPVYLSTLFGLVLVLLQVAGWLGGWGVAGLNGNIALSAKLELEVGLSLAKRSPLFQCTFVFLTHIMQQLWQSSWARPCP